jgi:hypothetical protein
MNAEERFDLGMEEGYLNHDLPPAMPDDEDYMLGWIAGHERVMAFQSGWEAAVQGRPYVALAHDDPDVVEAYRNGYVAAFGYGYGPEAIHAA